MTIINIPLEFIAIGIMGLIVYLSKPEHRCVQSTLLVQFMFAAIYLNASELYVIAVGGLLNYSFFGIYFRWLRAMNLARMAGIIGCYHMAILVGLIFETSIVYRYEYSEIMLILLGIQLIISIHGLINSRYSHFYKKGMWWLIDRRINL